MPVLAGFGSCLSPHVTPCHPKFHGTRKSIRRAATPNPQKKYDFSESYSVWGDMG